jgi:UDP-N-acetylglucosamine:LPS N-acetylglucosamine transferase
VIPTFTDSLHKVEYDKTNEKIKLLTVGGSAGAAFVELANASNLTNSKIFEFLVIGY